MHFNTKKIHQALTCARLVLFVYKNNNKLEPRIKKGSPNVGLQPTTLKPTEQIVGSDTDERSYLFKDLTLTQIVWFPDYKSIFIDNTK